MVKQLLAFEYIASDLLLKDLPDKPGDDKLVCTDNVATEHWMGYIMKGEGEIPHTRLRLGSG